MQLSIGYAINPTNSVIRWSIYKVISDYNCILIKQVIFEEPGSYLH